MPIKDKLNDRNTSELRADTTRINAHLPCPFRPCFAAIGAVVARVERWRVERPQCRNRYLRKQLFDGDFVFDFDFMAWRVICNRIKSANVNIRPRDSYHTNTSTSTFTSPILLSILHHFRFRFRFRILQRNHGVKLIANIVIGVSVSHYGTE